jgi:hypothetical protein
VVDQRLLNELCKKRGVKFQGLDQLRHVGKKGMWAFTWDLDSGYMNLEMFKPHQKYMIVDMGECMSADGEPISATNPRFVVCQAMPFGFQNSPWYFRLWAARNDGDDQIFYGFVLGGLGVYWIFFLTTALLRSEPIFSY